MRGRKGVVHRPCTPLSQTVRVSHLRSVRTTTAGVSFSTSLFSLLSLVSVFYLSLSLSLLTFLPAHLLSLFLSSHSTSLEGGGPGK